MEKMPAVSEEEAQADIERQLLRDAQRKHVKGVSCLPNVCCTGYKPAY